MSTKKCNSHDKKKILFFLFLVFLSIFSISFLLMPFSSSLKSDGDPSLIILSGGTFWFGLLGVICTSVAINVLRKKHFRQKTKKSYGAIRFFSNKIAKMFDIAFAVSLLFAFVALVFMKNSVVQFLSIACATFTFGMHWMLNSVNYDYIISKNKGECQK